MHTIPTIPPNLLYLSPLIHPNFDLYMDGTPWCFYNLPCDTPYNLPYQQPFKSGDFYSSMISLPYDPIYLIYMLVVHSTAYFYFLTLTLFLGKNGKEGEGRKGGKKR